MKTAKEIEKEIEIRLQKRSNFLDSNIEESGVSSTINDGHIQKLKLELEIAKNNGLMEVNVLVDLDNNEICSKKELCKNSSFFIVEYEGESYFINSSLKEKTLKNKYGIKKEKRLVPVHIVEIVDNCYRSRFFVAQNDKVLYSC